MENEYCIQSRNTAAGLQMDNASISSSRYDVMEQSCGWSKCKPKKLQKLNSPKWFLFFLAVFSVAQGMIINGFTNVGLSTLEKQFNLTSKQSGMIVAAKEISSLLLIAFLSFYGSFGHKPKYLGYGALLTSFGSLLYVLPHVLIGKHIPDGVTGMTNGKTCSIAATYNETVAEARCELLGSSEWYYLFIFIIAKLLIGAGTAPLFTLGAAYIDENVKPKVAPVYLGVWFVSTSFGPGIGFVAGGSLLNVYVDLIEPPGMDLSPSDPQWIGAWWIGHFFGGILILLSSCALLAYPRSMPGAKAMRLKAIKEGTIRPEDVRIQGNLRDMLPATLNLIKNATFMFNTLAVTCGTIIATGLGPFVVKYLQAQFGVSTMKAGVASGITLIPGTAGGIFIGSYLMRRLKGKDTCEAAARYCFFFQLAAIVSVASFLIPGCNRLVIAGIHQPYHDHTNIETFEKNLTSACNLNCGCQSLQFNPVCGIDNITYFSPCHLGCKYRSTKTDFGGCACINSSLLTTAVVVNWTEYAVTFEAPVTGVSGECDRDCKNMIPFLIGVVVLLVLNFVNAVPNKMVVMRCVPDNERAYALGVQWIFVTLLGAMPGPVLFGIFIDKTCDLWQTTCKGRGSCLVYDNKILSYELAGAILLFQVLAAVSYFISWRTFKPAENSVITNIDEILQSHDDDTPSSPTLSPNLTLVSALDDSSVSLVFGLSKQAASSSACTVTKEDNSSHINSKNSKIQQRVMQLESSI